MPREFGLRLGDVCRPRQAVPAAAETLIAEIEAGIARDTDASPAVEAARAYIQGELRMLQALRQIVIREMAGRLS